jgi:hypothetical protein
VPFEQWLLKWDPTNFSFTALVLLIVTTLILFVWLKWWPWWTKEAWPAKQKAEQHRLEIEAKQEEARTNVMVGIRDTLIELRVLVQQNAVTTQGMAERLLEKKPDVLQVASR